MKEGEGSKRRPGSIKTRGMHLRVKKPSTSMQLFLFITNVTSHSASLPTNSSFMSINTIHRCCYGVMKHTSHISALALLLYFQPRRFTDLSKRLETEDSTYNEIKLKTSGCSGVQRCPFTSNTETSETHTWIHISNTAEKGLWITMTFMFISGWQQTRHEDKTPNDGHCQNEFGCKTS